MIKLTKSVIDILNGSFNRNVSDDEEKDRILHNLYKLHHKLKTNQSKISYFVNDIKEFEEDIYDPGVMFMYWFENLMAETGNINLNFETQELSRRYWEAWHEKRRW